MQQCMESGKIALTIQILRKNLMEEREMEINQMVLHSRREYDFVDKDWVSPDREGENYLRLVEQHVSLH